MKTWLEPPDLPAPEALRAAIGGHPLVAQILARRGFDQSARAQMFLDPQAYSPAPPEALPDLAKAVARLRVALQRGETVCVWGDFDVDGQTATTLLVSALRRLGGQVTYYIPVRARESHGLHLPSLKRILDKGVQVVLTCDCGITAHEAVAYARQRGVDVIITDHHDLPLSPEGEGMVAPLPPAFAVVNPKRLPAGHPLSALPGVGVAYKLVEELYRQVGRSGECDQFLDLVALGIVADLALVVEDTRYLLQRGLQALRTTRRLGLQVMMELAELEPSGLSEEHIGYMLGPRLNAVGRLDDANPVVEFLTTPEAGLARLLGQKFEGLNIQRRLLTDQVFKGALAQIERDPSLLEMSALVLAHPSWHAGVIGIVAGRLVERFGKPTVLIATPPGELGRGSARSIPGLNIHEAIAAQRHLLQGFGGHPMAAGLSIAPEHIPEFRRALSRTVQRMLSAAPQEAGLQIEGYLPLSDLSLDLVADLERLAPFGPGNAAPLLVSREMRLVAQSTVGRDHEHLLLTVEDAQGRTFRLIWWQGAGWPLPEGRFDLAYTVRASTYRGQPQMQIEWVDYRLQADQALSLQIQRPPIEVIDDRQESQPGPLIQELLRQGVQIWCEGEAKEQYQGRDRQELEPAEALAICTIPPGPAELSAALEAVAPRKVYLFAIDPGGSQPQEFLARLAGLLKHALRAKGGWVRLSALAAATAQRQATVRAGIAWLEAHGHVHVLEDAGDEIRLGEGDGLERGPQPQVTARLRALLEETAAYRAYFAHAHPERLILNP